MNVWTDIHAALDEGRDPLDDPRVQQHLLDHPEDLAALLDLNDALRSVAVAEPVAFDDRGPHARRGAIVLAAVAAIFAVVVPMAPPREPTPNATVHSWDITVTTTRDGITTTSSSSKKPHQPPQHAPTIHHQTVSWNTPR